MGVKLADLAKFVPKMHRDEYDLKMLYDLKTEFQIYDLVFRPGEEDKRDTWIVDVKLPMGGDGFLIYPDNYVRHAKFAAALEHNLLPIEHCKVDHLTSGTNRRGYYEIVPVKEGDKLEFAYDTKEAISPGSA